MNLSVKGVRRENIYIPSHPILKIIDSINMNSYQEEDDTESIEAKMLISAKLLERMVSQSP